MSAPSKNRAGFLEVLAFALDFEAKTVYTRSRQSSTNGYMKKSKEAGNDVWCSVNCELFPLSLCPELPL